MSRASRLKVAGTVSLRFTNSPIARSWYETNLRGRTASSGFRGEEMRADGRPVMVTGEVSRVLQRERIGGKDGHHDEQWLQHLVHRHPTCIPMDQIEPGLPELIPVCMELPLSSGYLDNLLMTPEGDIVIVEVKLFGNPQARREVVAQALDYASSRRCQSKLT